MISSDQFFSKDENEHQVYDSESEVKSSQK